MQGALRQLFFIRDVEQLDIGNIGYALRNLFHIKYEVDVFDEFTDMNISLCHLFENLKMDESQGFDESMDISDIDYMETSETVNDDNENRQQALAAIFSNTKFFNLIYINR